MPSFCKSREFSKYYTLCARGIFVIITFRVKFETLKTFKNKIFSTFWNFCGILLCKWDNLCFLCFFILGTLMALLIFDLYYTKGHRAKTRWPWPRIFLHESCFGAKLQLSFSQQLRSLKKVKITPPYWPVATRDRDRFLWIIIKRAKFKLPVRI